MDKEVEVTNEDEKIISKNKKGIKIKKAPANHQSVDDMDFNDPEYLQMWEKEEILKRQKEERKKEEEEAALKRAEELESEEDEVENEEEEEEEEEGDEEEEEEEDEEEDEDEDEEDEEEDEENEEDGEESEGSLDEEEETKEAKKSEKKKPAIEKEPTNNLSRLDELKKLLTSYSNLFKSDSSKPNSKAKIDTEKLNSLTKSIYDLTFNYCSKKSLSAVKNDPATLVALFREMLVEINSVYLQRRLNDRRFPDLEKVVCLKEFKSSF
jgi:cobalamin biosynthesis protein CobT